MCSSHVWHSCRAVVTCSVAMAANSRATPGTNHRSTDLMPSAHLRYSPAVPGRILASIRPLCHHEAYEMDLYHLPVGRRPGHYPEHPGFPWPGRLGDGFGLPPTVG